ncbi:PREDICTED: tachykinin-3 [Nanorana parkeri]|uniref:tachykinin-3 n=1 Tax=Nanorana parkeri TaxID=125878 RepID=UPI000854C8EF|nr:PREDICTED: tachykinin-3 [Nanorana parkeri]
MRNNAVGLAILFLMAVHTCRGGCGEPQDTQGSGAQYKKTSDIYKLPPSLLKRFYDDDSYDGFVGLMGRRNSESKEFSSLPLKREMHDFFVGLMGKRNLQTGNPASEEKEVEPDSRYSTKCRKFRRSV